MPLYESVFISRPDISSAQVEALAENFKTLIGEHGGQVTKTEYWGLKTLAYRIKKSRKGHYSLMNLDAPPQAVSEMERNMRFNEDVIRFVTIRVDEPEEGQSAMMRNRGSRDDRGGRGDRGDRGRRDDRPRRDEPPQKDGGDGGTKASSAGGDE